MPHKKIVCLLYFVLYMGSCFAAEPLQNYGWQLFSADRKGVMKNLELAKQHGVTEIRLSHGIIINIDTINNNADRAELINEICNFCDENNMQTYVWAKELNIGEAKMTQDLDPKGGGKKMWDERKEAYDKAFKTCPKLDGIVLQFGSCPTEIWNVLPVTWYNLTTMPADRLVLAINQVQEICEKYNKKIDIRTFNHSPLEQSHMVKTLKKVNGYRAMVKEVPQDWQLYYPFNNIIGDSGKNDCTVEFDLSAEYWGKNKIPFIMTDYLSWRMREFSKRGISGVVIRIERSGNVLDSINKLNVYSMTRLVNDADTDPDIIMDDWLLKEYNIQPGTPENKKLKYIYRLSFDICRKMFYVLNQWVLEKSSSIPSSVRSKCLIGKNTPQWDIQYRQDWLKLCFPNETTLNRIWQEKTEAVELAEKALKKLNGLEQALPEKEYKNLKKGFEDLLYYTKVWRSVTDAVFRTKTFKFIKSEKSRAILEGDLEELEKLKNESSSRLNMARPERIEAFCEDLKQHFKHKNKTARPNVNILSNIECSAIGEGKAVVTWKSMQAGASAVEWGTKRPIYNHIINEKTHKRIKHTVTLEGLDSGSRYVFRVVTGKNVSGDYVFVYKTGKHQLLENTINSLTVISVNLPIKGEKITFDIINKYTIIP